VSVSELKNTLLEVVRRVERGEVVEITKGGKAVALLSPRNNASRPTTGFARVQVKGSLELPSQDFTYDVENLRKVAKTRKPGR
jgi:prevent-host-death family protein